MIMSEAEAKEKWCPFTFAVPEHRDQFTGQGIREGGPWSCCTTHCMAWRTAETPEFTRNAEYEFRKSGKRLKADTGYCAMLDRSLTSHNREGSDGAR
jgi:hypothetical protein